MDCRNIPILQISFNRPRLTQVIIDELRKLKPAKLYVFIDGPRGSIESDVPNVDACRNLWDSVDWECQIEKCFQTENMGCRDGVKFAIDWFFSKEEEGIILEDDCVPSGSFFRYCGELLERYREDDRVAVISGNNPIPTQLEKEFENGISYSFSGFPLIWGWATWKKSWKLYEEQVPQGNVEKVIRSYFPKKESREYWRHFILQAYSGSLNTWDAIWLFSLIKNRKLSVIPRLNLVTNTGFGSDATHTKNDNDLFFQASCNAGRDIVFPLEHPKQILRNTSIDETLDKIHFRVKRVPPLFLKKMRKIVERIKTSLWYRFHFFFRGRLPKSHTHPNWIVRIRNIDMNSVNDEFVFNESYSIKYSDPAKFSAESEKILVQEIFRPKAISPVIVDLSPGDGVSILYWKLKRPLANIYLNEKSRRAGSILEVNLRCWEFDGIHFLEGFQIPKLNQIDILKLSLPDLKDFPRVMDDNILNKVESLCFAFLSSDIGSSLLNSVFTRLRGTGFRMDFVQLSNGAYWLVGQKANTEKRLKRDSNAFSHENSID